MTKAYTLHKQLNNCSFHGHISNYVNSKCKNEDHKDNQQEEWGSPISMGTAQSGTRRRSMASMNANASDVSTATAERSSTSIISIG